jgi:hypothetical protein
MGNTKICRFIGSGLVAIALAGCVTGPRTSVDRVERAANTPNAPYSNVLIVGVARSPGNVRRFENALVSDITNENTKATPHHEKNPDEVVTEDMVQELVGRMQADAIVVTSVKQVDIGTDVSAERTEVERTRKNDNLVDFFRYDYDDITTPETVALTYNVVLTTDVYDAESGTKVYSLESSTMDAETTFDVIVAESAAIAAQLRRDGMLR